MRVEPLGQRAIVERIDNEEMQGGILIPQSAKAESQRARVVLTNRSCRYIKEGDIVIISQYGGSPIKTDTKEHIIIDEDSVLGIERE